jgi:hypothetical protein
VGKEEKSEGIVVISGKEDRKGLISEVIVCGPLREYLEGRKEGLPNFAGEGESKNFFGIKFEPSKIDFSDLPSFLYNILKNKANHRYFAAKMKERPPKEPAPLAKEEPVVEKTEEKIKEKAKTIEELLEKAKKLKTETEKADAKYIELSRDIDLKTAIEKNKQLAEIKKEIINAVSKEKNIEAALLDLKFEKDAENNLKTVITTLDEKGEEKELFRV